jgi:molybdopterin converting factor small subunit
MFGVAGKLDAELMRIRVRIGELLWKAAGAPPLELQLIDGASVAGALAELFHAHPALAAELPPGGKTRGGLPYHVFVNRRIVTEDEMAARLLKEGDTLHILTPTAGG